MTHPSTVCHVSFNHAAYDDRIYWKELLALKEAGYETVHICVGDADEDFISHEGIRIIVVKRKQFFSNPWVNRIAQALLFKRSTMHLVFQKAVLMHASVYHYHDLQLNALANKLKKLAWRPKVVYDAHEAYHLLFKEAQPKKKFYRILYSAFISFSKKWELKKASYCDYIIATDLYTLNYFDKYLPSIPNEIIFNYSFFIPDKDINTAKKYDFIYTGLLSEGRGIKEIVQAAALLLSEFPEATFLLLGPFETNEFETEIKSLVQQLNIEKSILIHAPVPFTQISTFYQMSRIGLGLFHNTPKYSTFIPIKLFEYMAFGLPVLFSDFGPSAAIIKETACGLLVSVEDRLSICTAMKKLLTDKSFYDQCSKSGRKAIEDKYNWQSEKKKLLKIYKNELLSDQ